jgi:hypothetical protein
LAAEAKVSSYFFDTRRICSPLAVYDERGRAVLLCCAPVLALHRFSRLFSTYLIMRVLDYKQEDFQWHVSKEYRTRLWSEVKAIIGTNVIFSALHVLCFYKSS